MPRRIPLRSPPEYRLNKDADIGVTYLDSYLSLSPKALQRRFGKPQSGGYESLGEYVFESSTGEVFTVYYLLQDAPSLMRMAYSVEFWKTEMEEEFHIGKTHGSSAEKFKQWLKAEVESE